jgi:hypothetical protein
MTVLLQPSKNGLEYDMLGTSTLMVFVNYDFGDNKKPCEINQSGHAMDTEQYVLIAILLILSCSSCCGRLVSLEKISVTNTVATG